MTLTDDVKPDEFITAKDNLSGADIKVISLAVGVCVTYAVVVV